jgi:prepilin signal peptidase PulO-like enzyme (type II secretory pathway)
MYGKPQTIDRMLNRDSIPDLMTIIGYAVALLFVAFGLYILFAPQMVNVPKEFRTIFGVTVIGYGIFRSVIIYQRSKERKEADDEN